MYTAFVGIVLGALILPAASSLFALWFDAEAARDSWVVVTAVPDVPLGILCSLVIAFWGIMTPRRTRAAHDETLDSHESDRRGTLRHP